MVRRWQQLPLDHALSCLPQVRAVLDDLAQRTAPGAGPVPDLGPAVVMDQLTVLVYDASALGQVAGLEGRLAELRRAFVS